MHLHAHKNDQTHNQILSSHNPNDPDGKQTQQWIITDNPILTPTDLTETPHPSASDTTTHATVINPHVTFSTYASNATKTILQSIASTQLVPLFVPNIALLPEKITTQINIINMQECLTHYPDRHKADYVINGLENGFDIGYSNATPHHNHRNLLSATEHQQAVTAAINKEVTRGHLSGPFSALLILNSTVHPSDRERRNMVAGG